jgi:hypothetical protein
MSAVQTTLTQPNQSRSKLYFPPLDATKPLAAVLKGTAWVEFPILHVIPQTEWEEGMKAGKIVLVPLAEPRGRDDMRAEKRPGEVEAQEGGTKKVKGIPEDQEKALGALGDYDSEEYDDDNDRGDDDHDDDDGHYDDDGEVNDRQDTVALEGLAEVGQDEGPNGDLTLDRGGDMGQDGALDEEARAAALFGAVDILGGPEMLLKVGEALAKDFGEVPSE